VFLFSYYYATRRHGKFKYIAAPPPTVDRKREAMAAADA